MLIPEISINFEIVGSKHINQDERSESSFPLVMFILQQNGQISKALNMEILRVVASLFRYSITDNGLEKPDKRRSNCETTY